MIKRSTNSIIKKLRLKFIAVVIIVSFVLLTSISALLCILSFNRSVDELSFSLNQALQRSTSAYIFPRQPENYYMLHQDEALAPFELNASHYGTNALPIPVAVYRISAGGVIDLVAQASQAVLSPQTLGTSIEEALNNTHDTGSLPHANLHFAKTYAYGSTYIAFAETSSLREWKRVAVMLVFGELVTLIFISVIVTLIANWLLLPTQRAWEEQRRFIADASHELKTPLTIILANISLITHHKDHTIQQEIQWINAIAHEVKRMEHLTGEMLRLAHVEESDKLVVTTLSLNELIEKELLQFEALAYEHHFTLECSSSEPIKIQADEDKIQQCFATLLDNACKYVNEQGFVRVELKRDARRAQVYITNSGGDISEKDALHLFERFYRSDKSRGSSIEGFGLGLSIAREIVRKHRGTLQLYAYGKGETCFRVTLPLKQPVKKLFDDK